MQKIIPGKIPALFIFIFSILIVTALPVHSTETGRIDVPVNNPSQALEPYSETQYDAQKNNLIEESAFHRFFKRGKDYLTLFGQQVNFVFSSYAEASSEVSKALNHLTGGRGLGYLAKILLLFFLLLAIGFGVEWLFNSYVKTYKEQIQSTIPESFMQMISRLSVRTLLDLISVAVFAFTILGVYLLFFPVQSPLHEVAMIYLPPIFIIRIAYILLNFLYSPAAPHMRIVPQNCPSSAMYFIGFMSFIIISFFAIKTLSMLKSHGLSESVYLFFYSLLGMLQFLILLAMLWKDRRRIARLIMKDQKTAESRSVSFIDKIKPLWFPLACTALLCFELIWQANLLLFKKDLVLPMLLTILSIPFGILLFFIGNRLLLIASGQTGLLDPRIVNKDILTKDTDISAFVKIALPPEPVSASPGDGSSNQKGSLFMRNLTLVRNLMGVLIACALFFWVMNLWGLDLPLGRSVVQSALSIFATLLLAYVVWEICRTIIDRKLEEESPLSEQDMEDMEGGVEGSRKGTLLTLLRKVIFTLIGVIVILTTLSAVGINIGPLLAGAGILGLAVGFGSQTLVRDILSGVFFLMDDAFRVGDYIQTAGTKGMVEHISLRSLRLRHPRGMIYTIPFGDMGSVQNFSRDYIITKLDFRVRYGTDVDKVRKIIKRINIEFEQDEELGPTLLGKVKSQGVKSLDDSAMIMRVKFKTKPGQQFVIRREVYRRIEEAFRASGIEFAHRNVTVYLPPEANGAASKEASGDGSIPAGTADKKMVEAGAAAAIAVSQEEEAEKNSKK